MKRVFVAFFSIFFLLLSMSVDVEAARFGGGRSSGMQRAVPQRQNISPAPQRQQATGAPSAPQRSWMGPLAGLAAGLGLGALFSHLGFGQGMGNFLSLLVFGFIAITAIRWVARKFAPQAQTQMQGHTSFEQAKPFEVQNTAFEPKVFQGSTAANQPEGFDAETFLRVAKLNFVRLQAANDEKNLADLREFVAPELFAEIKLQMDERGDAPQKTDVVTLNAKLLEVVTEEGRYIVSVDFSGMIREERNGAAEAFSEIWHLVKPVTGSAGWKVYGIQQA